MAPRRALLGLFATASSPAAAQAALEPDPYRLEWLHFRSRCITAEGRVVDNGNRGISHSEGQGVGLLLAAYFGDRAAFERILAWTRGALGRPGDALHAWRWRPGALVPVDDPNNATDGDLLIASALALAHDRWGEARHRSLATAIANDVLRLCTVTEEGRRVLLPGVTGFRQADGVVVNLSYFLYHCMERLHRLQPDPAWQAVRATGLELTRQARFGRYALPTDWLRLPRGRARIAPAPGWPPRFSWDAVRVPLYLVWAGHQGEPAVASAAAFWRDAERSDLPAWVDVTTGYIAPYPAPAGVRAVARLALAAQARTGRDAGQEAALPRIGDAGDYYSAKLVMLARMAWRESIPPAFMPMTAVPRQQG